MKLFFMHMSLALAGIPSIHGATWGSLKSVTCVKYGVRRYSAQLLNIVGSWETACANQPNTIFGIYFARPMLCENKGISGEWGSWDIPVSDGSCMPTWGSWADNGCVDTVNGIREFWSRLWNIDGDWDAICRSTPGVVDQVGYNFDAPTTCQNKGAAEGEVGLVRMPDVTCIGAAAWDAVQKLSCISSNIGYREYRARIYKVPSGTTDAIACANKAIVIKNQLFNKPNRCAPDSYSTPTGETFVAMSGFFNVLDDDCGVPPCPAGKSWDYSAGACRFCNGTSPPPVHDELDSLDGVVEIALTEPHSLMKRIKRAVIPDGSIEGHEAAFLEKRGIEPVCFPFSMPNPSIPALPGFGAIGIQSGPTAAQIAQSPQVLSVFQQAWEASFPRPGIVQEVGGWIYADPSNPQRIFVRTAATRGANARSQPASATNPSGSAISINLNNPEANPGNPAPAGFVLVANFHTHPLAAGPPANGNPQPSAADISNAWFRGVPGIVISRTGLWAYGPSQRLSLNGHRDYPNTAEDSGSQMSTQVGPIVDGSLWRPSRASNQQD